MLDKATLSPEDITKLTSETIGLQTTMTEPLHDLEPLDSLITALKETGIWGTLGTIGWVRETRGGGLMLQWDPSREREHAAASPEFTR